MSRATKVQEMQQNSSVFWLSIRTNFTPIHKVLLIFTSFQKAIFFGTLGMNTRCGKAASIGKGRYLICVMLTAIRELANLDYCVIS